MEYTLFDTLEQAEAVATKLPSLYFKSGISLDSHLLCPTTSEGVYALMNTSMTALLGYVILLMENKMITAY